LKNIIPTFLKKSFEFISFVIKDRDNKKVMITILALDIPRECVAIKLL